MAIGRRAPVSQLRRALAEGYRDGPDDFVEPLPGAEPRAPFPDGRWLWHDQPRLAPLTDPAAYDLGPAPGWRSPAEARSASTQPQDWADYRRHSLDVTMKGGVTSGVVYPLAVCELARRFRLRNIGGSSAGAIAAALAAAAELGRARAQVSGSASPGQGFPGLAETAGWAAELDRRGRSHSHRLAGLFQPGDAGVPVFAAAVAWLRGRYLRLPLVVTLALPWPLLLLIASLCFLGTLAAPWRTGTLGWASWVASLGWCLLWYCLGGLGTRLAAGFRSRRVPTGAAVWLVALLACAAALAALTPGLLPGGWWRTLTAYALTGTAWALVCLAWVFVHASNARRHRYGLIPGAVAPKAPRARAVLALAGAPLDSAPPLTSWLDRQLGELSGRPDEVLRFGHLWSLEYRPGIDPMAWPARSSRMVNLKVMSAELSLRAPVRFPCEPDQEPRYFDPEDLEGTLPQRVIDAMLGYGSLRARLPDGRDRELHRLPQGGELPVLFAVRASLALPGLFQALRIYRLAPDGPDPVDEFGRGYVPTPAGGPPPRRAASPEGSAAVEELWLTDGGVASNFPVHLFDEPLPPWPTVAINLSPRPPGHGDLDLSLPSQRPPARGLPIERGMLAFLSRVIGTSMEWRDLAHLGVPAFDARVATVYLGSDEGRLNLFMTRDQVAMLALRGLVAGMRLRRRFSSDAHWNRHQWLRLRVLSGNLAAFRRRLSAGLADPTIRALCAPDGREELGRIIAMMDSAADPDPSSWDPSTGTPPLHWHEGMDQGYWAALSELMTSAAAYDPGWEQLDQGLPRPGTELRQTPLT